MRIARFDNNRVGIVRDDGIHDMTGALEQLPAHRYPFLHHDALIANLDIFENANDNARRQAPERSWRRR